VAAARYPPICAVGGLPLIWSRGAPMRSFCASASTGSAALVRSFAWRASGIRACKALTDPGQYAQARGLPSCRPPCRQARRPQLRSNPLSPPRTGARPSRPGPGRQTHGTRHALTGPDGQGLLPHAPLIPLRHLGVRDRPHVSKTVVSRALAATSLPGDLIFRSQGGGRIRAASAVSTSGPTGPGPLTS